MQALLNKRLSRTILFASLILLSLIFAGYYSASPKLYDNARDRLPTWLAPPSPGGGDEKRPETPATSGDEPEIYPHETTSQFFPVFFDVSTAKKADLCASFPRYLLQRIQPVLKMGHGESRDKIEAQLDSVSACFAPDELLIFSDLAETIREHKVIDIIADLPDSYRGADNPDFEGYLTMQAMRANGTLDSDKEAMKKINGWKLDKYKFLPGVERAWNMRPGRDWYVFYETDTYIVWDNLFRFLSTMDPGKEHYIGSPSPGRLDERNGEKNKIKTWFANGGPGYILSRAAVEKLLERKVSKTTGRYLDPPLTIRWLDLLRRDCCGDSVMGWTLWNVNIHVEGYWPLFNPHPMHGVPYSEHYWCQPVVTLHKTRPEDMEHLWKWEHSRRRREKPLLYQDLWSFRHPGDEPTVLVKDHDNGGWADYRPPPEGPKIDSAASCQKACEASERCLQYLWRGLEAQECFLMFQIRYGLPRKPETEQVWGEEQQPDGSMKKVVLKEIKVDFTSGWMSERIKRWRDEMTCEVVQWVGPSITRVF
ncbi:family 31 glycosyltransferase [Coniochaeta sp. 2T2.1]|nr:family 31 glycosyltransferase [Coniochaeta sp. 2T2.1]